MTPMPRSALVVDDHPGFREAASALLRGVGFDVVGTAEGGRAAIAYMSQVQVDLVLVDLYLSDEDGVEVTRRIAALERPPTIVIISSQEDASSDPRVAASPAAAFIAKRDLSAARIRGLVP